MIQLEHVKQNRKEIYFMRTSAFPPKRTIQKPLEILLTKRSTEEIYRKNERFSTLKIILRPCESKLGEKKRATHVCENR